MECWQCGAEVRPGERTCGYCGARLTSPPGGRSHRPSQQRGPAPRRSRDDWPLEVDDESSYGPGYAPGDESLYGPSYRPDDRRRDRARSHSSYDDDGWDEPSQSDRRSPSRSRSQARRESRPEPDEYGGYPQADEPGVDEDYASQAYDARQPDPLDDPRAPRSLRSTPQRGPDARSGYPQEDRQRQAPPDIGDGQGRRPPTDQSSDYRHDEGSYRGRGPARVLPPLPDDHQGYGPGPYDGSRRSHPSSADNRYSRSSVARGQQPPYDDRYSGDYPDGYDDGYDDGYSEELQAPRHGYGRPVPEDESSSWYQQAGSRARSFQQHWGDTLSSLRIPGVRPREESAGAKKSSGRRGVTTVVLVLVLVVAVVGGGIVLAPRVLNRLNPTAQGTTSLLCTPKGADTNGTIPAASSNFKQYSSSRSHYGINYPETWTVEPQQKAANGYDYIDVYTLPNSVTSLSVEQAQAACALTDTSIIQGEVAAAQQQNITFTEVASAAKTQTIGSEKWQRREYDVSDKGVSLHMVILACHHQGRAYVIVLVSQTATFNQDNTGIFKPMLDSFTFLK